MERVMPGPRWPRFSSFVFVSKNIVFCRRLLDRPVIFHFHFQIYFVSNFQPLMTRPMGYGNVFEGCAELVQVELFPERNSSSRQLARRLGAQRASDGAPLRTRCCIEQSVYSLFFIFHRRFVNNRHSERPSSFSLSFTFVI